VEEALESDPKVDASTIAVSAADGHVTLRGAVDRFAERRAARRVASEVFGVVAVDDRLEVRFLDVQRRRDAQLRARILRLLMRDDRVPSTIDATVEDGFVTLTGRAEWPYQRDAAKLDAACVVGELDIFDRIEIAQPELDAQLIHGAIESELRRQATGDGLAIAVSLSDGTATLKGRVSSAAERDAAVAAAEATPGVVAVDDRLRIDHA
jgi:osmotically-inducible protein OsmY